MAYFTVDGYNSYSGCDITVTASLPIVNEKQMSKYYVLGSLQTLSISTHQDKRPVRSLGIINAKDYVMGPRTIAGSMVFAVFNRHFATEIMNDLGASGSEVILPDEIPALNITINFANEYGRMSRMAIYGVKIINEGQVMSINDLYTENTYQFVALGLEPLNSSIQETEGQQLEQLYKGYKPREIKFKDVSEDYLHTPTARKIIDNSKDFDYNLLSRNFLEVLPYEYTQMFGDWSPEIDQYKPSKEVAENINNYRPIVDLTFPSYTANHLIQNIKLTAKASRPIDESNMSPVRFEIVPDQNEGTIYIKDVSSKDNSNENNNSNNSFEGIQDNILKEKDYFIDVSNKSNYIITLPAGQYIAQFESPSYEYSNLSRFVTEEYKKSKADTLTEFHPFIDKMTSSSVLISSGNYQHRELCYLVDGGITNKISIGKKPILIENLSENNNYIFYTEKSNVGSIIANETSNILKSKTHKSSNLSIDLFKDFLTYNKNKIQTSLDKMLELLRSRNYNEYLTLIDLVLSLDDCNEKQEMLIYANILTRQLIDSYNISNPNIINGFNIRTPFESTVTINNANKVNCFEYNNYKSSIVKTINPLQEELCLKPNQHYCVQVLNNGTKTVKKDFAICHPSSYNILKNYCDVENYKNISLDNYLIEYNTFEYEAVRLQAIKENCYCDLFLFEEPYVFIRKDEVIVDVDFTTLREGQDYFLVVSTIYEALDFTPKRKIKFNSETKEIILNEYYLGHMKDTLLIWIENEKFFRVSKPAIYINENNILYPQIKAIENRNLNKKLDLIKKDLNLVLNNKILLNDLFLTIKGMNCQVKNIIDEIRIEFLRLFKASYSTSCEVLENLYRVLAVTHDNNFNMKNSKLSINLKRNKNFIEIKTDSEFIPCVVSYSESEKRKIDSTDNYVFYDNDDNYTMIYFIHKDLNYQTGFVLLENKTGRYIATDDIKSAIKEVGDN